MRIPVSRRSMDSLTDVRPGLKASPCERQRAQDFPPGLQQIEVGGVLGLEDELPAGMRQRAQQHISRTMGAQVIQDGVYALDLRRDPRLDRLQEIDEVGRGASQVWLGQRLAGRGLEGTKSVGSLTALPPSGACATRDRSCTASFATPVMTFNFSRSGQYQQSWSSATPLPRLRCLHLPQPMSHAGADRRYAQRNSGRPSRCSAPECG